MARYLKISAALVIGGAGLLFFLNNLISLQAAHAAVSHIVTGAEQPYYKLMGPAVTAGWMTWLAVATIMTGELIVGILGLSGAVQMLRNRGGIASEFNSSKTLALYGGAAGMLLWYGLFIVIGESYFNMWQTQIGTGSAEGAFRYGTVCAVLMFYIRMPDD